jgi:hypothetical protein
MSGSTRSSAGSVDASKDEGSTGLCPVYARASSFMTMTRTVEAELLDEQALHNYPEDSTAGRKLRSASTLAFRPLGEPL